MRYFLTALLLQFTLLSKSQSPIVLEYNLRTNAFNIEPPSYVREGQQISIKYTNANPLAFTSNAIFSDINHSYNDGSSSISAGLNTIASASSDVSDKKKKADSSVTPPATFMQEYITSSSTGRLNTIQNYLTRLNANLAGFQRIFNEIQEDVDIVNAIIGMDTLLKIARSNTELTDRATMESAIFGFVSVHSVNTPRDISTVYNTRINNIRRLSVQAVSTIDAMEGLLPNLSSTSQESVRLKRLVDSLRIRVSEIQNSYSGDNLRIISTNVGIIQANCLRLLNTTFEIRPKSIGVANGDYIQISDELKDNQGRVVLAMKPFRIQTYGGRRIDFSIGLSANIKGNGREFSLRKNPDNVTTGPDTNKVILYSSEKNNLIKFSPVVFIHWYKTTKKSYQLMLTSGLAPDFSTLANTKLYLGASLGFPASNDLAKRLVLSAGVALGYADALKTKYRDWADYRQFNSVEDEDLTSKSLRIGAFFGVSYNLGGTGHTGSTTSP